MSKIQRVRRTFYLFAVCSLQFAVSASAQSAIKSEEVDIVKAYQPLLADAEKIQLHAQPADIDTAVQPLQYDVKQHVIELPFTPAEIKPLALPQQQEQPLLNNMIKAGLGTQFTPLFEVYLGNGRSDKFNYGGSFHLLSSHASSNDYQDVSHLGGKIFGTSYFKNTALSAGLNFDQDVYHFYGFTRAYTDTSTALSKDLLKNQFQNLGVNAGFNNTSATKSGIDYNFRFHFHDLKHTAALDNIPDGTEDYFSFKAELGKTIQEIHSANVEFNFQKENYSSTADTSIGYFSILPNYQFHGKDLFVKAGLNLEVVGKEFKVNPVAEASYKLIGEYLVPYVGIFGENNPNTLKEISDANPFIAYYAPATSQILEGYFGLKGSYGNNIIYNLRMSYRDQKNVPFYYSIGQEPTVFSTYYYYDAKIFQFHGEIGYKESEHLNLLLSGDASSWDLDYNDQPIGIPKSKLTFSLNYNIQQKIIFNVDLFGQTGAYAYFPEDSTTTQMKGRVDMNLSATYNYKKNLAFWLSFNNLTAAKQREWYNYPTYGFGVMGGLMLKF